LSIKYFHKLLLKNKFRFYTFVKNQILRLIIFILLFTILPVWSQNPFYQIIDKSDGLPANSVFDIYQDRQGFMWFATGKGICRYDGLAFKKFLNNSETSMAGSCISEDNFGRIWYVNFDGYLQYVENGVLKSLKQPTSLGYFKYGIINNELYVVQPNAILIYDLKTLKIKSKIKIETDEIQFSFSHDSKFYVIGKYLYEFSSKQDVKKHKLPEGFNHDIKIPMMDVWENQLVIFSKNSDLYYTFKNGNFEKNQMNISVDYNQNTSIIQNDAWICSTNGVTRYDLIAKTQENYFKNENISFVYKDRQQNYWISTLNKGVIFVEDFESTQIELKQKPVELDFSKEHLFIGSDKNLVYQLEFNTLKIEKIFETKNNHLVNQMYVDSMSGNLFFTSHKFQVLDEQKNLITSISLATKDIKRLDEKYFLYAATFISGIFCLDESLKSDFDSLYFKNVKNDTKDFKHAILIQNSNGKSTEFNPENQKMYFATNLGLFSVDLNGKVTRCDYNKTPLYLTKIRRYKDKIIGISNSGRFFEIDKNNSVTEHEFPKNISKEKFHKFYLYGIYCYLFSENGVFEYNFETQKVIKVLSHGNELEASSVVLRNNQLYFATSKGLVIRSRNQIAKQADPKMIIDEVFVNGKKRNTKTTIELEPRENDVSINFSTLSFKPNHSYPIFYKINDEGWKSIDEYTKNLKLFSLSSGQYNIKLAINFNNKIHDIQEIKFNIEKPFWFNNLFILSIVLIVFFLFHGFYQLRIQKIKRQNELLLEKNQLEKNLNLSTLKAIKSQMNPHFFYNALNTIQSFILSNDKKLALHYLSKFSSLTRKILEMSEKDLITVAEEIETMTLYLDLEKARFDQEFEYEITLKNIEDAYLIKIPSLLLQPYVENAVKHGLLHKKGDKKITIEFLKIENMLQISIEDNGIGREKSAALNAIKNKNHQSFATNAMQNKIELLNKNRNRKISIHIKDKLNQNLQSMGTIVEIIIPFTE